MIMCVLLCYPLSIHMSQLLSTGRPISSSVLTCIYVLGHKKIPLCEYQARICLYSFCMNY